MKRLLLLLFCLSLSAAAFAQEIVYEPKFKPQSPEIMAQGGSFMANAKAFHALYTNPAGFSSGKPSLTLLAANPWLYLFPDEEMRSALEAIAANPLGGIGLLNDIMTSSGTGLGLQAGLGFVGGGFGLGFIVMNDTYAYGKNTLGIEVSTAATAAVIAGLSFPIHLGEFTITPGGAVRPMYRIRAYDVGLTDVLGIVAGDGSSGGGPEVLGGTGLGIDLGVNVSYGPLLGAIAIRDLGGTQFQFGTMTFEEASANVGQMILPEGEPISESEVQFVIPMSFHLGFQYHPDFGDLSFLLDPYVHAEIVLTDGKEEEPIWNKIHLGAEVRLLQFIRLRAGLNQGYTTFGVGLKLLFLEAHVAYFGRELGPFPGAQQGQGVTAEVALRF